MVNIFHFSDEWKVVSVAPQREGCISPPISPEFFSDILGTASRLNILYGLETWYAQLSRHVTIIENFVTSTILNFYVMLQFFATASVIKCLETLNFHIVYMF